jgi:glycine C-acetyltransferase
MEAAGFTVLPGEHPIVAVMISDERRAMELAAEIRAHGVLVVAFTHPVVPRGAARIRVQLSAAHTDAEVDCAVTAFVRAGRRLGPLTAEAS